MTKNKSYFTKLKTPDENRTSILREIENVREKWEEGQFGYLPHFSENELIEIGDNVKAIDELLKITPSESNLSKLFLKVSKKLKSESS